MVPVKLIKNEINITKVCNKFFRLSNFKPQITFETKFANLSNKTTQSAGIIFKD